LHKRAISKLLSNGRTGISLAWEPIPMGSHVSKKKERKFIQERKRLWPTRTKGKHAYLKKGGSIQLFLFVDGKKDDRRRGYTKKMLDQKRGKRGERKGIEKEGWGKGRSVLPQ